MLSFGVTLGIQVQMQPFGVTLGSPLQMSPFGVTLGIKVQMPPFGVTLGIQVQDLPFGVTLGIQVQMLSFGVTLGIQVQMTPFRATLGIRLLRVPIQLGQQSEPHGRNMRSETTGRTKCVSASRWKRKFYVQIRWRAENAQKQLLCSRISPISRASASDGRILSVQQENPG